MEANEGCLKMFDPSLPHLVNYLSTVYSKHFQCHVGKTNCLNVYEYFNWITTIQNVINYSIKESSPNEYNL